jgi:hypothetical protein
MIKRIILAVALAASGLQGLEAATKKTQNTPSKKTSQKAQPKKAAPSKKAPQKKAPVKSKAAPKTTKPKKVDPKQKKEMDRKKAQKNMQLKMAKLALGATVKIAKTVAPIAAQHLGKQAQAMTQTVDDMHKSGMQNAAAVTDKVTTLMSSPDIQTLTNLSVRGALSPIVEDLVKNQNDLIEQLQAAMEKQYGAQVGLLVSRMLTALSPDDMKKLLNDLLVGNNAIAAINDFKHMSDASKSSAMRAARSKLTANDLKNLDNVLNMPATDLQGYVTMLQSQVMSNIAPVAKDATRGILQELQADRDVKSYFTDPTVKAATQAVLEAGMAGIILDLQDTLNQNPTQEEFETHRHELVEKMVDDFIKVSDHLWQAKDTDKIKNLLITDAQRHLDSEFAEQLSALRNVPFAPSAEESDFNADQISAASQFLQDQPAPTRTLPAEGSDVDVDSLTLPTFAPGELDNNVPPSSSSLDSADESGETPASLQGATAASRSPRSSADESGVSSQSDFTTQIQARQKGLRKTPTSAPKKPAADSDIAAGLNKKFAGTTGAKPVEDPAYWND